MIAVVTLLQLLFESQFVNNNNNNIIYYNLFYFVLVYQSFVIDQFRIVVVVRYGTISIIKYEHTFRKGVSILCIMYGMWNGVCGTILGLDY